MAEVNQTLDLRHHFYPSCPYNNSVVLLVLRLSLIGLGTVGLIFFNVLVGLVYFIYSVGFNGFIWPVIHCQYCYYKVRETTVENETGKTKTNLLPLDTWKETYLDKHVACGKKWGSPNLMILWLVPIALMCIYLILNFSTDVLIILISFVGVLVGLGIYTRWRVCPTCAFMKECHAAF